MRKDVAFGCVFFVLFRFFRRHCDRSTQCEVEQPHSSVELGNSPFTHRFIFFLIVFVHPASPQVKGGRGDLEKQNKTTDEKQHPPNPLERGNWDRQRNERNATIETDLLPVGQCVRTACSVLHYATLRSK